MTEILTYLDTYVLPNYELFKSADKALTHLIIQKAEQSYIDDAKSDLLRVSMNLATPSYHIADWIWEKYRNVDPAMVFGQSSLRDYRSYLDKHECFYNGKGKPIDDLNLLGSVVDAFKHFKLNNSARAVADAKATIVISNGWGVLPYGEGKYGGIDEVLIRTNKSINNKPIIRSFSCVVGNVILMWERLIR